MPTRYGESKNRGFTTQSEIRYEQKEDAETAAKKALAQQAPAQAKKTGVDTSGGQYRLPSNPILGNATDPTKPEPVWDYKTATADPLVVSTQSSVSGVVSVSRNGVMS